MNKKLKLGLNLTVIVLEQVGIYLREQRFKALEARVVELEMRSNTMGKVLATKADRDHEHSPVKGNLPLRYPYMASGEFPYGKPFGV